MNGVHGRVGEEYGVQPWPWKREGRRDKNDECIVLVKGIKSSREAVPKSAGFTLGVIPITSGRD